MLEALIATTMAVLGVLGGSLISLGFHKKEHIVLNEQLKELQEAVNKHDERLNLNDVNIAAVQTSLNYIMKQLDHTVATVDSLAQRSFE